MYYGQVAYLLLETKKQYRSRDISFGQKKLWAYNITKLHQFLMRGRQNDQIRTFTKCSR